MKTDIWTIIKISVNLINIIFLRKHFSKTSYFPEKLPLLDIIYTQYTEDF